MLFNSLEFLVFLPAVVLLYYLLPHQVRWLVLLVASYTFYMSWRPEFALLIAASTVIDWAVALGMGRLATKRQRAPLLVLSLVGNLGMLALFKYSDFFITSLNRVAGTGLAELDWVLPVGISFYTFQTLSYTLDVYRGDVPPERHLGRFALFVIYFPQLVAGPIERYSDLAPQLQIRHVLNYDNFARGFRLVLLGLAIKMVVADRLATYVDLFYNDPSAWNGGSILLALAFYAFQIYCDFYGYSLVAVGSAQLIGVNLMENFRTPYLATTVGEFWQRWHISLSQWFRDYLFIPLGGSRVAFLRLAINILIVFGLSGLWHGANWTFLAWGLGWGLAYLLEKALGKVYRLPQPRPYSLLHGLHALKIFAIASIAWIAFRSPSLGNMKLVAKGLLAFPTECDSLNVDLTTLCALGTFILLDIALYNRRFDTWCGTWPWPLRWLSYAGLAYAILLFASQEEFPFIYFQF
jgi:alginate O-acetyltransferase complex protein AlgI